MKRRTKAQRFQDYYSAFHDIVSGQPVKRKRAKDGSVPHHPVVPCPDLPEREVLAQVLRWLKVHHIFHDRHDCGAGDFGHGFASYGIKNAGDIIGILPGGRHLEIEVKRGKGGRLSKGQQDRARDVGLAGGLYIVVSGIPELEYYLGNIK